MIFRLDHLVMRNLRNALWNVEYVLRRAEYAQAYSAFALYGDGSDFSEDVSDMVPEPLGVDPLPIEPLPTPDGSLWGSLPPVGPPIEIISK
jgi:hypothetical protein